MKKHHRPETDEQIAAACVGVNYGTFHISGYRQGNPTMICGLGRSGTTALATCYLRSSDGFVTDDTSIGSNLEIVGMNAAISNRQADVLAAFREKTVEEYDPSFIFKNPAYEIVMRSSPELRDAWHGANLILMCRDPLVVSMREASVARDDERCRTQHLMDAANRCAASMAGAIEASTTMGVTVVSYEKLIQFPQEIAGRLNTWMGEVRLNPSICEDAVVPNESTYIQRQTLGKMRGGNRSG